MTCNVSFQTEFRNTMPASSYQQQKLRVCEVCGAYLGIHDNDRRLADHFGGKLHLGFITIRSKLLELLVGSLTCVGSEMYMCVCLYIYIWQQSRENVMLFNEFLSTHITIAHNFCELLCPSSV